MKDTNQRPIILVSNSSWYLFHYRKLLIKEIKKANNHLLALAPYDSTSKNLSKLLVHIPWRMSRGEDQNIYSFFVSCLRMFFLIRAIKPKLIHSHTLSANLITSIISSFFGINSVLSFAGIGRFSKSSGLKKQFFIYIFKLIYLFSNFQRISRFKFLINPNRSFFIFQNKSDINFIKREVLNLNNKYFCIIPGSGVPDLYISKSKICSIKSSWKKSNGNLSEKGQLINKITFIYCARLLKSKGILIFLELSRLNPNSRFIIYGSIDNSSQDSLTKGEISFFKENYKNITFIENKRDPLVYEKNNFPILVVPSIYGEGFPRGIIEANTLSIPVIASKDASRKIPIKNLTYSSENNNVISYNKCIKKIINEYYSGRLNLKLNEAKEIVIKNFSEKKIVKSTMEIYKFLEQDKNQSYLLNKDRNKLDDWLAQ